MPVNVILLAEKLTATRLKAESKLDVAVPPSYMLVTLMSLINTENRRFPRIHHVSSRQIIRVDDTQTPQQNIVLTENLSSCGIKFTTNSKIESPSYFLIYLNDLLLRDIKINSANLLKSGDYYLARVVWCQKVRGPFHKIGAAFLERQNCQEQEIETFTELVNISMLDLLPEAIVEWQ